MAAGIVRDQPMRITECTVRLAISAAHSSSVKETERIEIVGQLRFGGPVAQMRGQAVSHVRRIWRQVDRRQPAPDDR